MNPNPLIPGGIYKIEVVARQSGTSDLIVILLLTVILLLIVGLAGLILYRLRGTGSVRIPLSSVQRVAVISLISLISLYFLWRVRDLLPPFFIAFFLASLLDPVVTRMQRRGLPRGRAVAYIFAGVFLTILAGITLIIPSAADQMRDLTTNTPNYTKTFTKQADDLYNQYKKSLNTLGVKESPSRYLGEKSGPVADATKNILDAVKSAVLGFAGRVLWLVIIPLSLFYFLLDYQVIRAKLISFFPLQYRSSIDKMSQEVVDIFSQYIRGLAKVCVLYGFTAVVLFAVFRLPYALFLGIAAGILYAVPYVGPGLAMSSAAIISLTAGKGVPYTGVVVAAFIIMHVTFDYGVTPRVVGGSVGLHPLVNVFALMVGATIFGVPGMLLAVPVAASIQRLLSHFFPRLAQQPIVPPEVAVSPTPDENVRWEDEAGIQPALD